MAINSYFTSKRGRAVGVSLAGAGLGQVFIPHIVRLFLDHYGFRVAVLAMSMLSLVGVSIQINKAHLNIYIYFLVCTANRCTAFEAISTI